MCTLGQEWMCLGFSADLCPACTAQSKDWGLDEEGPQNTSSTEVYCVGRENRHNHGIVERGQICSRIRDKNMAKPWFKSRSVGGQIYVMYLSLHFIFCKMRIIKPTATGLIQSLDKMLPSIYWMMPVYCFHLIPSVPWGPELKISQCSSMIESNPLPLGGSMKWSPLFTSR